MANVKETIPVKGIAAIVINDVFILNDRRDDSIELYRTHNEADKHMIDQQQE